MNLSHRTRGQFYSIVLDPNSIQTGGCGIDCNDPEDLKNTFDFVVGD